MIKARLSKGKKKKRIQSKDSLNVVLDKYFAWASEQDGWVHISIIKFPDEEAENGK